MKKKYYINKSRHNKTLKTSAIIGLTSLVALILINFIFYSLSGFIIVYTVLGGAVLISLITFYRTIFLLRLPLITIDDHIIRYFNVLWYNRHRWDKFELAYFDADNPSISIGLTNGRIFDRFLLDSLSQQDVDDIKNHFIAKGKLVR